jgi:hypothetical protein
LIKNILAKYKALERKCDLILCEGTDYRGVSSAFEFDLNADVAKTKLLDSEVAGRATVFIFPDLNTGNNLYKAVQRLAGSTSWSLPQMKSLKSWNKPCSV